MNKELTAQIIKHIFSNLGIIGNKLNTNYSKSLNSKEFLLNDKIKFELSDGTILNNKVWGCQYTSNNQNLKILLGDCSQDSSDFSYCLIVQLDNSPSYGMILNLDPAVENDPLIAYSINNKDWIVCNTYLQATFLAGMEQLKELGLSWNICHSYNEQYQMMLSFIKYHEFYYEENSEGTLFQ